MATQAQKLFVNWVKANDPFLYKVAVERYKMQTGNTMGGFADFFGGLVDTVKNVAPDVLKYREQKKILDIQLKRAQNNLPPIDATHYTPSVAPDAATEAQQELAARRLAAKSLGEKAQGMQKYFLLGVAGVLGYVLLRGRR